MTSVISMPPCPKSLAGLKPYKVRTGYREKLDARELVPCISPAPDCRFPLLHSGRGEVGIAPVVLYPTLDRKAVSASLKASGCSRFDRCAADGRITNSEPLICSWMTREAATGVAGSSSPTMISVGTVMAL